MKTLHERVLEFTNVLNAFEGLSGEAKLIYTSYFALGMQAGLQGFFDNCREAAETDPVNAVVPVDFVDHFEPTYMGMAVDVIALCRRRIERAQNKAEAETEIPSSLAAVIVPGSNDGN